MVFIFYIIYIDSSYVHIKKAKFEICSRMFLPCRYRDGVYMVSLRIVPVLVYLLYCFDVPVQN